MSDGQSIEERAVLAALRAVNKIILMKAHGRWPATADRHEINAAIECYQTMQRRYGFDTFAQVAAWMREHEHRLPA